MKKIYLLLLLLFFGCSIPPTPTLVFRFAGDVMFDRGIKRVLGLGVEPFRHVLHLTTNADIMMVNLETTVATQGIRVEKAFNFMSAPSSLYWLTNAGVRLVSIANNHTMDYGLPALLQTRSSLDAYNIRYSGAGTNFSQAVQPVILTNQGIRLGFLAFGDIYPLFLYADSERPGIAGVDPKRALAQVEALRPLVDVLVVSLHWGWEYDDFPQEYQKSIAHAYIDSGADLVIGHHPHVLQGVERYKQGVIFYSLGNFVFDQKKELKTRYTLVGELQVHRTPTNFIHEVLIHPFIKDYTDYMPRPLDKKEHTEWMTHFQYLSAPLGRVRLVSLDDTGSAYRLDFKENRTDPLPDSEQSPALP